MPLQHCTWSVLLYVQGASYTDQAKDWGSRIAGNLSGQAEYLKNKVAGPGTTTVQISCLTTYLLTVALCDHICQTLL